MMDVTVRGGRMDGFVFEIEDDIDMLILDVVDMDEEFLRAHERVRLMRGNGKPLPIPTTAVELTIHRTPDGAWVDGRQL
jgi:hypothetical protein